MSIDCSFVTLPEPLLGELALRPESAQAVIDRAATRRSWVAHRWDALNFLFAGRGIDRLRIRATRELLDPSDGLEEPGPLDFLAAGGRWLDVDAHNGIRLYGAAQVRLIARALLALDRAALEARIDPAEMGDLGLYAFGSARDVEEEREALVHAALATRAILLAAAEAHEALLVWHW